MMDDFTWQAIKLIRQLCLVIEGTAPLCMSEVERLRHMSGLSKLRRASLHLQGVI